MGENVVLREAVPTNLRVDRLGDTINQISKMQDILENRGDHYLKTARNAMGVSITAEDCVGQMRFRDGSVFNIIPDISLAGNSSEKASKILMYMLYSVFNMEIKQSTESDLFEFFVHVYIDEVNKLLAKGLRSKYVLVEGNENSFRGKILFAQHIRENYIHKERVYVEYEIYSQNRPENRLIKRTLEILSRNTTDSNNLKNLKILLSNFEEIDSSTNIGRDFEMCIMDRNMVDYISPLLWCNIFLRVMGLGGDSKSNISFALLVNAEELFAAYVARVSSKGRQDGSFSIRYTADVETDGRNNGASVILIRLKWNFYDRKNNVNVNDAERMFMSAPGYRVIPPIQKGGRVRAMAGSYLADMLA